MEPAMQAHPIPNLTINGDRLWDTIHDTAQFGATPKGGINRQALTETDRLVRDWFRTQCEAAGCTVSIDALGTMFARRPGRNPTLPPIAIGSHLDTQPTGGRYDGIIGVLAGLEILRTLAESGYETNAPIEIINWTNEEGARFAPAMLASGVFAGVFPPEFAETRTDRAGISFATALDAIAYRGPLPPTGHALSAHFELHIEQGPLLEAEGKTIGVVTGVQSMRWYDVTVTGRDSHAGTTPMHLRHDALLGAARMIASLADVAQAHGPDAKTTTGLVEVRPNSRNVVPGEILFSMDLRHPDDDQVASMERAVFARLHDIATEAGLTLHIETTWISPAVRFDPACLTAIRNAAAIAGHAARDITSGAGHDSAYLARVCPTAMIFVPCAGGLSHNEAESATQTDVTAGADVLLRAVLDFDRGLGDTATNPHRDQTR
jgi:N-carbamoyl-L-amino-acid hydrolase